MAWRVAQSLEKLRDQIDEKYPDRSKESDGTIGDGDHQNRSSDHNPWFQDHIVTALDITHDPDVGVNIDRLTDELAASRDPRIKYLIANGLILDSREGNNPWVWVDYTGPNPHRTHMHVSVIPDDSADDTRRWDLPSLGDDDDGPPPFPLPGGYYYGPLSGPDESISGRYPTDTNEQRAGLKRWQRRLADLGWSIDPDGYYGPETEHVAREFQEDKDLEVDGLIGPETWNAAWNE